MGLRRLWRWAALLLGVVAMGWLAAAGPAQARAFDLSGLACLGGADRVEAAYNIASSELDCDTTAHRSDRFVRARIDLAPLGALPPGPLIWQTDPTSFDSMLIRLDYADGSQRLIDVDSQMAVRNWDANGNFWVPIQQDGAALTAIDVVVERPQSTAVFTRMELSSEPEAMASNYSRTLLYVLICGTLLVPIVYDLLFYRVLRRRFMIWHLAMTVGTLLYTLFNSGLAIVLWPEMSSFTRYAAVFWAISLVILGSARFLLLILEDGSASPVGAKILHYAVLANVGMALVLTLGLEVLRMRAATLYFLSTLPVIAATGAVLTSALLRGSRAAVFLTCAYVGLIIAGTIQVIAILGVIPRSDVIDESIYAGLVILVLGTSAGVADRFLIIRSERDRAWMTARKLGAMANSDGLTGLLNRRAFDLNRRLARGQALLVADIDRFKSINDTYGHQRGDTVLCHAARVIEDAITAQGNAQVYRLGGEEFAVLAPVADGAEMRELAETIRSAIERSGARSDGFDMPDITISVGAVMGGGQLMHVAFAEADLALYRAKEGGRNRCEFSEA